jgi:hypothetical protein
MATQSEKINKLDKDIALIKQEINTVPMINIFAKFNFCILKKYYEKT